MGMDQRFFKEAPDHDHVTNPHFELLLDLHGGTDLYHELAKQRGLAAFIQDGPVYTGNGTYAQVSKEQIENAVTELNTEDSGNYNSTYIVPALQELLEQVQDDDLLWYTWSN